MPSLGKISTVLRKKDAVIVKTLLTVKIRDGKFQINRLKTMSCSLLVRLFPTNCFSNE